MGESNKSERKKVSSSKKSQEKVHTHPVTKKEISGSKSENGVYKGQVTKKEVVAGDKKEENVYNGPVTFLGGTGPQRKEDTFTSAEYWFRLGEQHRKVNRDLESAIIDYENSIAIEPDQFWAHYNKAECFNELGFEDGLNINDLDLAQKAIRAYGSASDHFDDENAPKWVRFWTHYHIGELHRRSVEVKSNGLEESLQKAKAHYGEAAKFICDEVGEHKFWVHYNLGETNILLRELYRKKAGESEGDVRKRFHGLMYQRRQSAKKSYKSSSKLVHLLKKEDEDHRFLAFYKSGFYSIRGDTKHERKKIEELGTSLEEISKLTAIYERMCSNAGKNPAVNYLTQSLDFIEKEQIIQGIRRKDVIEGIEKQYKAVADSFLKASKGVASLQKGK